ncbi:MAG: carboxypeptidase-like regulatory domain-containing protein, partial [Candidatus Kapabacteria bacterium]|nr:carboxypeptidase-like regulatory domain-containing protein [Candidatus Kapabacteria bacterium]
MKLRTVILGICLTFLLFVKAISQDGGEIHGQIIDNETGEPLRRATVLLTGTKFGAFTDAKGMFTIKKIPAGKYNLKISFVGYSAKELTGVDVKVGETTNIGSLVLGIENNLTEEIFVDAERVDDNEAAILSIRKSSTQVSDGISRQEMSRLPDSDAGQSLKRVSGVTLVDNKFVYVRGVSERYNNTTLNGASLSSTEPDKKAFAFDMFPTEFLRNVNIAKSFTPDLPGNFAGGLVQLNTLDFPDKNIIKVTYSNSFNSNVSFKGNKFIYTAGGNSDWLGLDDGTRAMPADFPNSRRELDALRTAALNPADNTGALQKYESISKAFNSKSWKQNPMTVGALANSSIGVNYSSIQNLYGNDLGILGSINWGQTYDVHDIERNALLADGSTMFSSNGTKSTRSANLGALLNLAYKLDANSAISLRNVYNRNADDESVALHGQDSAYQFIDYRNYSTQYVEKELYSTQLGGEHRFGTGDILLEWNTGYSYANRYEPDFRKVRYDRQLYNLEYDPNTPYYVQLIQTEQGDGGRVGRFFSNMNDNTFSGKIDLAMPISKSINLKIGTLAEYKDRDFGARSLTIIPTPTGRYISPEIEALMSDYENPHLLFAEENFRVEDGLRISEETKMSDSYDAQEELFAAYVMLDIPFELYSENFRLIGGVRYEDNRQMMNSFDVNDA